MVRAPGVSKTAPSAPKAFCMSMTIRAQLRGSMVKKFLPEALGLEDMGLSFLNILRIVAERYVLVLVLVCQTIRAKLGHSHRARRSMADSSPACPVPGAPL